MPLNDNSVVSQNEGQVSADMLGELALMSIQNGKYYSLNETGSRIWSLIKDPVCVEDVCAVLLEEFDVDGPTCRDSVVAVLSSLAEEGLVEVRNASAA